MLANQERRVHPLIICGLAFQASARVKSVRLALVSATLPQVDS